MSDYKNTSIRLATILLFALAIRIYYFTGLGVGDDVIYITQTLAHAMSGMWPPVHDHWSTRIGLTLPTALLLRWLGYEPWVFVLFPLAASMVKVLVCFMVGKAILGEKGGLIASLILATFPLDIIYATHVYPDTLIGLFSSVALISWVWALQTDRHAYFITTGVFLGVAYFCHETIIMQAPVYLALWLLLSRKISFRYFWVLLIPAAFVVTEMLLYYLSTHDMFYRFDSILAQQSNPDNLKKYIATPASGLPFLLPPLFMLVGSHEYGLYMLVAILLSIAMLSKPNPLRPYALWLFFGYIWLYYGTTVPYHWIPLAHDPRYSMYLTIPASLLIAAGILKLTNLYRWVFLTVLVITGALAPAVEEGNFALKPYQLFLESSYAHSATMGCYNYMVARWVSGFDRLVDYGYSTELGCGSRQTEIEKIKGSASMPLKTARFAVLSEKRESSKIRELESQGWSIAEKIPGKARDARAVIARILLLIPGQKSRANNILNPPGLLVLKHPVISSSKYH